jgi:hypothetical protein
MISNATKHSLICVAIFLIALLSILIYITKRRGEPITVQNLDSFFEIAKDGDIICRLGDRLWSQAFKDLSAFDKRYSHMGIIRINNDQITVIHSEGTAKTGKDVVKEVAIESFIKNALVIGIYRLKNLDGSQISSIAKEYLGVPFDWQFDMEDGSKIYCTELLYLVLRRLAPTLKLNTVFIKEIEKEIIPLDSISSSEHFSEVYYLQAPASAK